MINGIIDQAEEANNQAQRESIIEKIEADIYTEKVKKGRNLTKSEVEKIIIQGGFGTISNGILTTEDGNCNIPLSEIIGWNQANEDSGQ